MQLPGIPGLRIHGSAARDRWFGGSGADAVPAGSFQNALFLFCGRRKDRIKGLYWEGDGFVLLYKRLESGSFQWPRNGE